MRILIILLCIACNLTAQETTLLQGRIINEYENVDGVVIRNKNSFQTAISDKNGTYEILASQGDVLIFEGLLFKEEEVVITSKTIESKTLLLYLIPNVTQLAEVHLSSNKLNGNLSDDATSFVVTELPSLGYDNVQPLSAEKRRLYTAKSTFKDPDNIGIPTLAISLDGIINALSGKTKRLKKHLAISEYDMKISKLRSMYEDSMFVNALHIPKERINDFLMYIFKNGKHIDRIQQYNELDILSHLEKRSKDYIGVLEKEGNQYEFSRG